MQTLALKTPEEAMLQVNSIFVTERKPEEIDLIDQVRKILHEAGLAVECSNNYDTNMYIRDAMTLCPKGQRFLLNRFWSLQLMTLQDVSTIEERFCLIENGEFHDWLRLFKDKIVPCLIAHRLPVKI